ncbi:histidine phosphatase family protein [Paenibacillus thailandensis]|uniref:Histidine phosphatase family protein n=1 Tax=Paenibacillus thailandensis TaxID=393250 RepID=A0ABW5R3N4_9BACL
MKTIYVVRHCKAEGQAPDARLTGEGVRQAEKLAEFLAARNVDCIVSSPFERAVRTIKPLADRLGLEIRLNEALTERILTDKDHPDWREMLRRTFDDPELCYEGGESSRAATSRIVRTAAEILRSGCSNAVIVSHGNLISLLLKHYDHRFGFREWEFLSNPDVYKLTFDNDTPAIRRIWPG